MSSCKPQLIYHQLDEPFFPNPYGENSGISALHDLYPGRPLNVNDGFNRYEIPAEDPAGARRTFLNSKRETQEYAAYLVDRTLADGGGDDKKVLTHALDDPSSVINDPDLKNATMQSPQTENEGMALKEPPMLGPRPSRDDTLDSRPVLRMTVDGINAVARGRQIEGNARSEGLTRNPDVAGIPGIERFTATDDREEHGSKNLFSHLFLALLLVLLIMALVTLVRK